MSSGKVKCTCGWSWNKSDSSKKDMYICHECGRDNSNNMKNGGWLDNYGEEANANEGHSSASDNWRGEGYSNVGRNSSPAWGGQFQNGGKAPKYVESKNDPRYKAYQDSLTLYNNYNDLKKSLSSQEYENLGSKGQSFENALKFAKLKRGNKDRAEIKKEQNSLYSLIDFIPGQINRTLPRQLYSESIEPKSMDEYRAPSFYFKEDTVPGRPHDARRVANYSNVKPQQQVIVKEKKPEYTLKEKYDYDPGFRSTKEYVKVYNTPQVQSIQNNLQPAGLVQGDFDIDADAEIHPEVRRAKYYDVEDFTHGSTNYNGRQTNYRTSDLSSLEEQSPNNTRKIVPHYQMGGSVYPVNYVPQAQNGWLGDIEGSVNKSLGNPMRKGINAGDVFGEKWFNPKTKKWEIEGRDNIRHSFSGRYTSEAIQDKLHNIPILSQLAGTIGSTALGVGHELSTLFNSKDDRGWYDKIRESGEDAFNNTVGAVVGSLPISSETKTNTLGKLSNKNRLPDGVSGRANSVYVKHAMGGSVPGAVGFSYARTQGDIPSKGPRRNQTDVTDASAQNGKEMQYYQNGLDWQPKTISKNGSWLSKYDKAQTGTKKFKLKDERDLAYKPAESTMIKNKNFDLEQDKERKTYLSQLADQQKENSRRKKLTQDQREREDYNARNEERGSIQAHVPESTWDRSKAIASNPLTAFGYAARNQSLPARFQHGERNVLDNAIDWVNPLQGVAAVSEIPGELGRGEYLNAGLSLLDAADLGVYAKGAKKQLRNVAPSLGYREGGVIKDDRGQWDHPGEITEIGSNEITMQGVPYDVLGVSDEGDTKLMKPGKNYKFKGKKVTEYPMAQNGLRQEQKGLQNLDNLTNFTNYNKPQPGGWLNKYN